MGEKLTLAELPVEILEHVCSFMAIVDVAKLEKVSLRLRSVIGQTRAWRHKAEKVSARFEYPLGRALLKYVKASGLSDSSRHYKVIIGVLAQTKRYISDLEKAGEVYKEGGKKELDKYRMQRDLGINQTGRGFNIWMKKVVKFYIQEELMKAKVVQISHHQEELRLDGGPNEVLKESLPSFFPDNPEDKTEGSVDKDCYYVQDRIKEYLDWVQGVIHPTDKEVQDALVKKSHEILDRIREAMEIPEDEAE